MNWLDKITRRNQLELDSNWRNANFCVIDLETTGLDFEKDEIVSLGAVQIRSARITTDANYYREVRPNRMPSSSSIRIHGIRPVDLENASSIETVIPEFSHELRGRIIVAHAAWVEKAFLKFSLQKVGLSLSKKLIDTAALARSCGVVEDNLEGEPSLEFLARTLNLPVYSPHHALGDALTTATIFLALATEIEKRKFDDGRMVLTLRELLRISEKSARAKW